MQQDTEVTEVEGTSWIIAEKPKLLEQLGFELHGAISEEVRAQHFAEETRPIHYASISRKVLLETYL